MDLQFVVSFEIQLSSYRYYHLVVRQNPANADSFFPKIGLQLFGGRRSGKSQEARTRAEFVPTASSAFISF